MTRRPASEEERELFEAALADAVPLGKRKKPPKKKTPAPVAAKTPSPPQPPRQKPKSSRPASGLDGNTAERLRRGMREPEARLDLHGLTLREAHAALVTFLRAARMRKLRLVLVVTGKGSQRSFDDAFDLELDMSRRGVLRAKTPRWLKEPGLAELVVHVSEAHRRHGGAGALYVYLRKQA